ncbi:reverse transcriptase domain-containing protein [Tanacetum coccineum]
MLVDALLQHEMEGQVNMMVEKVKGQKIRQEVVGMAKGVAEVAMEVVKMVKKVIRVVKELVEKMESVQDISRYGENQKVKYTVGSLISKALTWWNSQVQTRGRESVIGITWEDFKTLAREEFCPNNEMQKLETEFWCHAMVEC